MPKRLSKPKRPTDVNQLAHQLINESTADPVRVTRSEISRIMAAMGSKGGKKSAKLRMKTTTPEQRSQQALKAAQARWSKENRSAR